MRPLPYLILSLLAACLTCCDDPNASKARALQNEIGQLQENIIDAQQTVKRLEIQVQAAREERKKLEDDKAKAGEQKTKAEEDLKKLKEDFEAYKARYKISMRQRAPGLLLGDMEVNGVAYYKAKITEMNDVSIRFSHHAGMSSALLKELPEPIRDTLALTPNHDPSPLTVSVGRKKTELELATEHKQKQRQLDMQLNELQASLVAAQREAHYAASVMKRRDPPERKALEYAQATELRQNQLAARRALLEVEKTQLYAIYQAELRKLRASR